MLRYRHDKTASDSTTSTNKTNKTRMVMDTDKTDTIGMIGAAMAGAFPILDFFGPVIQILGAIGGLVLLFYSIKYKRMQILEIKKNKKSGED